MRLARTQFAPAHFRQGHGNTLNPRLVPGKNNPFAKNVPGPWFGKSHTLPKNAADRHGFCLQPFPSSIWSPAGPEAAEALILMLNFPHARAISA